MLSDTTIKAAKPKDKPYKLSDGQGLYVLVHPNGGKYFRYDYKFKDKRKTLALGVYPTTSLKEARAKRDHAKKALQNNDDPSVISQQTELNTFDVLANEWGSKRFKTDWLNPRCIQRRRLELYVYPTLGHKPIHSITTRQIMQCLEAMESKGIIASAKRTGTTLGQIFRYAIRKGVISADVTLSLKGAFEVPVAKHRAAILDPDALGLLLRNIHSYNGSLPVVAALKLMPLVFVRSNELRMAKWSDIDFDKNEWSFYIAKTKTEHIVPLSTQAVEILTSLAPLTSHGVYVFSLSPSADKPIASMSMVKALRSLGYAETEQSIHGFRAIARTRLDDGLGFRPDFIEHQLAHKVKDANGKAYNRTSFLKERHNMMQTWSDYLDKLKG